MVVDNVCWLNDVDTGPGFTYDVYSRSAQHLTFHYRRTEPNILGFVIGIVLLSNPLTLFDTFPL